MNTTTQRIEIGSADTVTASNPKGRARRIKALKVETTHTMANARQERDSLFCKAGELLRLGKLVACVEALGKASDTSRKTLDPFQLDRVDA